MKQIFAFSIKNCPAYPKDKYIVIDGQPARKKNHEKAVLIDAQVKFMSENIIKVFIIDDHPIVLSGIKAELSKQSNIRVIGEALNGRDAIEKLQKISPDIILMDISMPDMNGLKATEHIKKHMPDVKIIALTMHNNINYAAELIRLGAHGYIVKDSDPEELIQAIRSVNSDKPYYSRKIQTDLLEQHALKIVKSRKSFIQPKLTPREINILKCLVEGLSNKEIAQKLNISVRTVETHRDHIYKKLNLRSIAELTRYAIAEGLIDIS